MSSFILNVRMRFSTVDVKSMSKVPHGICAGRCSFVDSAISSVYLVVPVFSSLATA